MDAVKVTQPEQEVKSMRKRRDKIRSDYVDARGYWPTSFDGLLEIDPDFFEAYMAFAAAARARGALDARTRELVSIAIDATVTHLYSPGNAESHPAGPEHRGDLRGDSGSSGTCFIGWDSHSNRGCADTA